MGLARFGLGSIRRLLVGGRETAARCRRLHLPVYGLDGLAEVGLDGVEGGQHGRRAEAVRDRREMRQVTLQRRIDDRREARITDRRSILTQHV